MSLPPIISFWHGPLSWLEVLCITAFVRCGHQVLVYSYDPIGSLPQGAEWRDAADVLPKEKLVFYKGKGTPGVFSDHFRYAVLRMGLGVYADLDIYCVKPIEGPPDYLFAWERPGSVNGAILHISADAPLLADLISIFETAKRPLFEPHLPPMRRFEVAIRRLVGDRVTPEHMQYGATGPMALTHYVARHGLIPQVRPAATFYPVPYEGIPALMKSGSSLETAIKPETLGIHLWRSQLTDRGRAGLPLPEAGSALAALCAAEGITPASIG
ncbi:glycosyltransferase family 32 protein [Devosia sp. CAU 1758]